MQRPNPAKCRPLQGVRVRHLSIRRFQKKIMQRPNDVKETEPHHGGQKMSGDKLASTYKLLVEQTQYLYVRVVKAKDIPVNDVSGSCAPYAEVRVGNYKETTHHIEKKSNPEWNQVFAFPKDGIQARVLEVTVKDKDIVTKDDFMGWVPFDLTEVPTSVPPDSPLAPQWYRLEDRKGNELKQELMLSVWWGSEADEALCEAAGHADATSSDSVVVGADTLLHSKVYLSPTLWYVRVNVIEAQDLVPSSDITKTPQLVVTATLGHLKLKTRISTSRSINPVWNEELMLVAAEPFEEPLILSVEDRSALYGNNIVGTCALPLCSVERRSDNKFIKSRWLNLEKAVIGEEKKEDKFGSRLRTTICLEGGYHVFDESTHYSGDLRPTEKKLWKKSIGVLEVEILGATGLSLMKDTTTDAYCVAKYGMKWVRTRTIVNSRDPKWNEQCSWKVFDPCTVLTIGVFDNCNLPGAPKWNEQCSWKGFDPCTVLNIGVFDNFILPGGNNDAGVRARDSSIGKIRIRLSTLEPNRLYSQAYPLHVLHPSGVKKMGEIHLAVRFTCSSLLNMMHKYSQPLLPEMHYIRPLTVNQLDMLRDHATQIVSMRLRRAEPPLREEVVEYMLMLDPGSRTWSLRKSKANVFRVMGVFSGLIAAFKWFDDIRNWKNPTATLVVHIVFVVLVLYPQFILPSFFLSLILIGVLNHKVRPRQPPHVDTRLSCADDVDPDELDEEFDTFPTSCPPDIVRMRYDRLRSVCGRLQNVVGDLATQGEKLQSLLTWRDPTATTIVIIFCLIAAVVVYLKPLYAVVIQTGFTVLSHPRFQHNLPLVPFNFFRRLPSKVDYML